MSSDPGISSSQLRIALAVVLGVLGGLTALWYAFRWDRKRREKLKRTDDLELGSPPSRPQRREDRPTNRYDDTRNDTTLPAYNLREADETPSLFRLSSSIASLKVAEQEPSTSPFHLIFFERISKLQAMMKEVQSRLEAAPPEGYETQSKEGRELADLKKEMLELVGTPERVTDVHPNPDPPPNDTPSISVTSDPEPHPSPNDRASRHELLLQLHLLLIRLSPIASKSSPDHDSTFDGLNASIETIIRSLDAVPIPPPTLSNAGENDSRPPFTPHLQPPSREDQLPPYEHS